jgi:demethylmenaquinone methyltransferase/2-methoxy-6-polyprenyl-1,4-benzoquinol methylase
MSSFYQAGEQRAAKVQQLFARIARRYDLINDLQSFGLHRRWKRVVARLARVNRGACALDVCCGTGDIAMLMAKEGADVTGLDFSEEMLAVARKRAATELDNSQPARGNFNAQPPLVYITGDAQKLPFPDSTFDAVTVGYGLRNLASWDRGLEEMVRVAKAGGRVLVLDFGKPDNRIWRAVYYSYLRVFVPLLGLLFCGSASAYAYILESLQHYPAQHGVADKMQALKLTNTRIVNFLGGVMTVNYGEKR